MEIYNLIKDFPEEKLFHIDIDFLMENLEINRKDLITKLINEVFEGNLVLEWIFHCPHCGNVAKETLSLHKANHDDYCPLCKVDFVNTIDINIEVFFNIHPSKKIIKKEIKENYFKSLEKELLDKGNDAWKNSSVIYAIELINNLSFRSILGDEVLDLNQSLEVLKVSILFTDIKDSTKMYSTHGDFKAFKIVKEHFNYIFETIKIHNGLPIKTIGDAIMGVFHSEEDAIKTSKELQILFHKSYRDKKHKVKLKIGLYTGPAILVTLNDRLDYFGQSVNLAARIQGKSSEDEICFKYKTYEKYKNYFPKNKWIIKKKSWKLKGIENSYSIVHLSLKKNKIKNKNFSINFLKKSKI